MLFGVPTFCKQADFKFVNPVPVIVTVCPLTEGFAVIVQEAVTTVKVVPCSCQAQLPSGLRGRKALLAYSNFLSEPAVVAGSLTLTTPVIGANDRTIAFSKLNLNIGS